MAGRGSGKRRWTDVLALVGAEGGPSGPLLRRGAEAAAARTADGRTEGLRHSLQPAAMRPGNVCRLLVDGAESYPAMLEAIGRAERSVDIETYIWQDDLAGRRFAQALAGRARAGCRVRCLLDGAGTLATPRSLFADLFQAGGELAVFHPVGPWRRRWGWSVRDHRKLMLVDDRVAFTGGLNLADDYAPADWGGGAWHDMHLMLEGPAVADLARLFEDAWRYACARGGGARPSAWAPPQAVASSPPPDEATEGLAQPLAIGRRRDRRFIQRHYQFAIAMSRQRAWLFSAYFIPNRSWRRTLCRAARRGVDVRVLVPRLSDIPAVNFASRATFQQLLDAGVRIFEYLPRMMHAKALVVDSCWCAVGSYNLDERSLRYNWELSVALVDRATCARLEAQLLDDLASAREIDPVLWPRRSIWEKVQERLFHFFRWFL